MDLYDPPVEELFAGAAAFGFQPARFMIVAVDPSLRVACSACIFTDGSRAPFRPGAPLEGLLGDGSFKAEVLGLVPSVLTGELHTLEVSVARPSGHTRVGFHVLPRFHAPESQQGLFLIGYDMARLDAAAAEARAVSERLAAILGHAADALVVADESGEIEQVNQAAATMFGWPPEQLVGQPLTVLMDEPYASLHQRYIEGYLHTGESAILNVGPRPFTGRRKDGGRISIELAIGEARVAGSRKFIGAARDISDGLRQEEALRQANRTLHDKVSELQRVGAELSEQRRRSVALADAAQAARTEAERATVAKSKLLATVSHELRTPLNGMLAAADLLAVQEMAPEAAKLVDIVRRAGRDLVSLVSDLLDLSRIEAGALATVEEPFSPQELLTTVGDLWRAAAAAKGLTLNVSSDRMPPLLLGDQMRLGQVLGNLVYNGIKYTPQGHVTLTASCSDRGDGAWRLVFGVSDSGPGLNPAALEHLFEPYARGGSEHSRKETGTGAGLAISHELVELMGGDIRAGNIEGGGAMIEVELTLKQASAAPVSADWEAQEPCSYPLRVLIAEDHDVNRTILALLLDELGCHYEMSVDGEEALAVASRTQFDLILMDVRMPKMDGLEAARAIRSGGGPSASAMIVAVTADARASDDPEIFDAGIDDVLTKPISLASLAAVLAGTSAHATKAAAQDWRSNHSNADGGR